MIPVVIGTRGSPLALAQTKLTMAALKKAWRGRNFEIHVIKTEGDRIADAPGLDGAELGQGLFTSEIEQALAEKKIDIAVHSLKDMPTEVREDLVIAAVPPRADARDRLITRGAKTLHELAPGAMIATGSPRRAAQLLFARPDFQVVPIRGNIDTRLGKFREAPEWSGLILAAAGLDRLSPDLSDLETTPLSYEEMLPAPGQGALAIQTRAEDKATIDLVMALHDPATSAAVVAERMFLHALGGGCLEPIAAYAETVGDEMLKIDGVAWLFGESTPRRASLKGLQSDAERLGLALAVEMSR
jgi:hydroxymethylbilane synthase